jgi:hypothetical protein
MQNILSSILPSSLLAIGMTVSSANADNPAYAPGDLVLFFQKLGSSNTVYVNLGNAAKNFRGPAAGPADGVNKINFLNINTELTTAFGPSWAFDPTLYAGAAGVWGSSATDKVTLQDGDPNRTLYITKARSAVGAVGSPDSSGWDLSLAGNTAMTSAASGIESQNNVLESYTSATAVVTTFSSFIDDQNPFLSPGIQGPAMNGALEGGIQQAGATAAFGTFGGAGQVEFALDLYRVLASDVASNQIHGTERVGSYEGTITVGTDGKVSFIATNEVKQPEIVVQQPVGTGLADGKVTKNFGSLAVGKTSTAKTFTIKNTGKANLTNLAITKNGTQATDFIVSALPVTSLLPGKSTTFTVKFKPTAKGVRNSAIHIKSNDANENPFDIKLTGTGS